MIAEVPDKLVCQARQRHASYRRAQPADIVQGASLRRVGAALGNRICRCASVGALVAESRIPARTLRILRAGLGIPGLRSYGRDRSAR